MRVQEIGRSEVIMDPQISAMVKRAVVLWTGNAVEHLKDYPDRMAELKKAMEDEAADVRIIYYVRANAISIERFDLSERTFTEIFREELVPDDGGAGGGGNG
jgi:ABC-type uncharacterized transport system ATPase subunit